MKALVNKKKNIIEKLNEKINELVDNNIVYNIIRILFIIGLTGITIFNYYYKNDNKYLIVNIVFSLIMGIIMLRNDFRKNIKDPINIITFIGITFTFYMLSQPYFVKCEIPFLTGIVRKMFKLVMAFTILYIAITVIKYIWEFLKEFYSKVDKTEKKYIVISTIFFCGLIAILYNKNEGFFMQYDVVYSMDSGWVTNNMIPKFDYIDIRHLFFSTLALPIHFVAIYILRILFLPETFYYIIVGVINFTFLQMTAIMLKRMMNSKMVMIIYTLSSPFLIYSIFTEKYQLAVFLIVLFIYAKYIKNKSLENVALVCSIGAMSTTAFIGVFLDNIRDNYKNFFKRGIICLITFLGVIAIVGNMKYIVEICDNVAEMSNGFKSDTTIRENVNSTFSMIAGCAYALPYQVQNNVFRWKNIISNTNIIGVLIAIICIVGFIKNRKDKLAQISAYWFVFAFILFIGIKWASHESPLFSIYFSWAIISLLIMGIEKLFEKNIKIKNSIYICIIISMVIINGKHMVDLCNFILANNNYIQ